MHTLFAEMESTFLVSMNAYIDIFYELINYLHQGWIYWGHTGEVHTPLALARGGVLYNIIGIYQEYHNNIFINFPHNLNSSSVSIY